MAANWPEGVPELPAIRTHFILSTRADGAREWVVASFNAVTTMEAEIRIESPAIVVLRGAITHANAAARALGILPDAAPESPNA